MNLTEIESIAKEVLKFSPTVATALTGPVGGMVATLVSSALGCNSSDPSAILSSISTDPDISVKLKSVEEDLAKYKISIGASDTANARQFQVQEEQAGKSDLMPVIVTVFLMASFVGVLLLLFFPIVTSQQNTTLIATMTGLLTREFIQACRFYIGGDDSSS